MSLQSQVLTFEPESASSLDSLDSLLQTRLPYSLPLLRRIQQARARGLLTAQARVVFVSEDDIAASAARTGDEAVKFTATYVDVSFGPETQMWLFSTLEAEDASSAAAVVDDEDLYRSHLDAVISSVSSLARIYGQPLTYGRAVLLGSLHTSVRRLLGDKISGRATGFYDKWLFRGEDLPGAEADGGELEEGMVWDGPGESDLELAVSRTDIPRTPDTLRGLPSVFIRLQDGTPIAWSFLGLDGSLISLHCEPEYRRRGLAKRLAGRLMRQGPSSLGSSDGWLSADVSATNEASRNVCRSLGGAPRWEVSWVLLHLSLSDDGDS